jgi:DNA processing protein
VLQATPAALALIPGISQTKALSFCNHWQSDEPVLAEMLLVEQHGVSLLSIEDEGYPKLLKWINDPPPLLYVKGRFAEEDALGLAIVGARKCTRYGREMADRFAAGCSQLGLTIISGGAYGIDAAAHQAALRIKGRTIAVIGNGLAKPYPDAHRDLFDAIVTSGCGAVISEFPMTTSPRPENFPARNRIISGLSLGTLVIEAANRSGALITARLAAEDHGREVMAVPGPVDSAMSEGCHRIIREGWATLVTKPAEVLENLGEAGQLLQAHAPGKTDDVPQQPSLFTANLSDHGQ